MALRRLRDVCETWVERLWYRPRGLGFWLAFPLLGPLTALTALASERRRRQRGAPSRAAVVAVGNLTVGGTGKTQVVLWLALRALAQGRTVAIVSRGFGGLARAPLRVAPDTDAAVAGDEPVLLARRLPAAQVIVSRDRGRGVALATAGGADLVLLDDGLQQRAVEPQRRVVVFGADAPLGNGALLPLGPLREGLAALRDSDLLWVHGAGSAAGLPRIEVRSETRFGGLWSRQGEVGARPRRVLVFSGIARAERFATTVRAAGFEALDFLRFADHRRFSRSDAEALVRRGVVLGAEALLCTEKDLVRWPDLSLPLPVFALRAEVQITAGEAAAATLGRER